MIRRLALFATATAAISVTVSACGGDDKRARIRSFSASPAVLPTAGGETTLTWDVRNAERIEIEPDIGVVTGTSSYTLTVTETTEFTLIARRDGRVTRRETMVTIAAPGTITGVVRSSPGRERLPDVAVFVNGKATVTDENGAFSFEDVPTPYDVAIFDPAESFAMIWQGLTRPDPILEVPGSYGSDFNISVSGTATPATADANTFTRVYVKNEAEALPGFANANAAGAYSLPVIWTSLDDGPVDAAALGLRYTTDPGTGVVTFTHFTRTALTLDPAVGPVSSFDFALAPVSNTISTGDLLLDPQENLVFTQPTMILDSATGASSDMGFPLPVQAFVATTANAFSLATPDIAGSVIVWHGYEEIAIGAFGMRAMRFAPGAQDVQVDFPQLPRLLSPVDDGQITRDTLFQMAGLPSSAKMWAFNGSSVTILVLTDRAVLTLPELPEAGIRFQDGESISWNVMEISPLSGADVAGPGGLFGATPDLFGFSTGRSVLLDTP